jgi:hypothetical protein
MSLWGNLDASNNAPNFSGLTGYDTSTTGESLANSQPSSVFGNTYLSATRTGVEFGVFGVDTIEANNQLSTGDGRYVTHAGWVARTKGSGPVVSVSANTDAVGPAASACTYTLVLSGGGTNNTSAQVTVTTAATGKISAITLTNSGVYTGTPTTNTFGNTVFTFTMGGRNGRVQQETLVAMGSMTGDATASDDANYPDS